MSQHTLNISALAAGQNAVGDVVYKAPVAVVGVRAVFVPTANTLSGAATLSFVGLVVGPDGTKYEEATPVTATLSAGATTVTTFTAPAANAFGPPVAVDGLRLKVAAASGSGTLSGLLKVSVWLE